MYVMAMLGTPLTLKKNEQVFNHETEGSFRVQPRQPPSPSATAAATAAAVLSFTARFPPLFPVKEGQDTHNNLSSVGLLNAAMLRHTSQCCDTTSALKY